MCAYCGTKSIGTKKLPKVYHYDFTYSLHATFGMPLHISVANLVQEHSPSSHIIVVKSLEPDKHCPITGHFSPARITDPWVQLTLPTNREVKM